MVPTTRRFVASSESLMPPGLTRRYDRGELIADGMVHAIGLAFALAGSAFLLGRAGELTNTFESASLCIYCLALVAMLAFSGAYNLWPPGRRKWALRRCDQSSIYVLIAATPMPFAVHAGAEAVSNGPLLALWVLALIGVGSKLCSELSFDPLAVVPYVVLALSAIVGFVPVWSRIPASATCLVLIGALLYLAGTIFYLWERLRFHSAIWHCFVLAGAACHYLAILDCTAS